MKVAIDVNRDYKEQQRPNDKFQKALNKNLCLDEKATFLAINRTCVYLTYF